MGEVANQAYLLHVDTFSTGIGASQNLNSASKSSHLRIIGNEVVDRELLKRVSAIFDNNISIFYDISRIQVFFVLTQISVSFF